MLLPTCQTDQVDSGSYRDLALVFAPDVLQPGKWLHSIKYPLSRRLAKTNLLSAGCVIRRIGYKAIVVGLCALLQRIFSWLQT